MFETAKPLQGTRPGPRKCDVHVISAVRTDTGWLMRLRVHGDGNDKETTVRIPATADAGDAIERIKAACDSARNEDRRAGPRSDGPGDDSGV